MYPLHKAKNNSSHAHKTGSWYFWYRRITLLSYSCEGLLISDRMARENLIPRSPKVAPYMVWNFWYIKPNTYFLHEKEKPAFSNSSSLKSVFGKAPFSWRISVDGSVNSGDKAANSNFFRVVWTLPHTNRQERLSDFSHHLNLGSVNNCYKSFSVARFETSKHAQGSITIIWRH